MLYPIGFAGPVIVVVVGREGLLYPIMLSIIIHPLHRPTDNYHLHRLTLRQRERLFPFIVIRVQATFQTRRVVDGIGMIITLR